MNGLGKLMYFLMIWAAIGALVSFAGGIWLAWWIITHVQIGII